MARTTLDIADPVLEDLRALQKRERRSMGSIASELLADALALRRERHSAHGPTLRWLSRDMGAPRVNLDDSAALRTLLDEGDAVVRGAQVRR